MNSSQATQESNDAGSPKSVIEKIDNYLKEQGVSATIDQAIEGGVITFEIIPELMKSLKTYETAKVAFEEKFRTSLYMVDVDLEGYPWKSPTTSRLEVVIVKHGQTTPAERDILAVVMDKAGYRPLISAELMALVIERTSVNNNSLRFFSTYDTFSAKGIVQCPSFNFNLHKRFLRGEDVSFDWIRQVRYTFVPK